MLSARFGGNPGKAAMVEIRRIAIAVAACAATWIPALADDQKAANSSEQSSPDAQGRFVPRLNDMMVATQLRHFKLWYAGVVQNWPLANYELTQIRDAITDTERLFANKGGAKMSAMMTPPADAVADAIRAKDFEEVRERVHEAHRILQLVPRSRWLWLHQNQGPETVPARDVAIQRRSVSCEVTAQGPTVAMRRLLVAPGVPNGTPATTIMRSPSPAKPSIKA